MNINIEDKRKLLCENANYKVFSKGNTIYVEDVKTSCCIFKDSLPILRRKIFSICRITRRLARLEIKFGIFICNEIVLLSFNGGVYRLDLGIRSVTLEHKYASGISNPLSFCKCENSGRVLYGEYYSDGRDKQVSILERSKDGDWKIVFSFPLGVVKHIHNIIYNPLKKSFYVLTGDYDNESGIIEFTEDFSSIRFVCWGKQKYRACICFPCNDGIIYATDTPLEDNYIYFIPYTSFSENEFIDVNKICPEFFEKRHNPKSIFEQYPLKGSCIYGKVMHNENFAFSTTVEPDSKISGLRFKVTYKLGYGIKDRYSHIIIGNCKDGFHEIFRAKKDVWPMLLFQFGTFQFPESSNHLKITGRGLEKYDGKTVLIKI